jgi:hypothetical protein
MSCDLGILLLSLRSSKCGGGETGRRTTLRW